MCDTSQKEMPDRRAGSMRQVRLILGDCVQVMQTIETGSCPAVVCDPPYG